MFLTVVMFSNRLIPHLFSKKIHASTLKKSLLSLFPYFHFCIFNIKTMHITWLESVIGISKDLFHFNLRYKFLLNYFPLTSLATASYGLTSQFLLTATICHLNHRLNGIPFVPQKLRNFPAILEHRKIQTNPL